MNMEVHMRDLADTAQTLRSAKRACRQFLSLWALDCLSGKSTPREREGADRTDFPADYLPPGEHAWAELYRGSILDD
jgi:hypothetical protein